MSSQVARKEAAIYATEDSMIATVVTETRDVYKEKLRLYNDKIKAGEAWLEWAENNRDKIFD